MSNPAPALGGKVAVMSYFPTKSTFDPKMADTLGIFQRKTHNMSLSPQESLQSFLVILVLYFAPLISGPGG